MESDDEEISQEIDVTFLPRPEALAERDITEDDFTAALVDALDELHELAARDDLTEHDLPPLEEMILNIKGRTYKLEDLADVEVREKTD